MEAFARCICEQGVDEQLSRKVDQSHALQRRRTDVQPAVQTFTTHLLHVHDEREVRLCTPTLSVLAWILPKTI